MKTMRIAFAAGSERSGTVLQALAGEPGLNLNGGCTGPEEFSDV